jgi:hypothetical protein
MKMINPFKNTRVMQRDSLGKKIFYWALCFAIAIGMGIVASGSGGPETVEPLPHWVNVGSNFLCVVIGILVVLPGTRVMGANAAMFTMVASMIRNIIIDGIPFFLGVLPLNLVIITMCIAVAWHHEE